MEIVVKGKEIILEKDYLTDAEVHVIVQEALKAYNKKGDFEDYDYSPLSMNTVFYILLFAQCIKDYDDKSLDVYNEYYNAGVQYELLNVVTNAKEAYDLMMTISKSMSSIENIISKNLNKLIDSAMSKIPDDETMIKMIDSLPQEWQNTLKQYNQIIGKGDE